MEDDNSPASVASALGFAGAGIMAGQGAKTADKVKLAKAIELEKEGIPPQNIFQATGWYRGTDGEWKFEISDQPSKLNQVLSPPLPPEEEVQFQKLAGRPSRKNPITTDRMPLSSVLDHPQLYDAYPALRNLPYQQMDLSFLQAHGMADEGGVALDVEAPNPRSTLLHELQHIIQRNEGFALGGNPEGVGEIGFSPESLGNDPVEAYRRLAGEVEARNVQNRLDPPATWSASAGRDLTAADIAPVNPIYSEDIPAARQLRYWLGEKQPIPQMEILKLLSKVLR